MAGLQEISASLEADLLRLTSAAPSYDGQFGLQIEAIGSEAAARVRALTVLLDARSEYLAAKADAFEAADEAVRSDLDMLGALIDTWFKEWTAGQSEGAAGRRPRGLAALPPPRRSRGPGTLPPWLIEFLLSILPFGDSVGLLRQLQNLVGGQDVDDLELLLSALGLGLDALGGGIPGPDDAGLAALKAIAKVIPPGPAREAFVDLLKQAAKNPEELGRLGKAGAKLLSHGDLVEKLAAKNPQMVVSLLNHGPEAIDAVARYGDEGIELVGKYGDEGVRILRQAEERAAGAYESAVNGGLHSGTVQNYQSRPIREIKRAVRGYETQVRLHIDKLLNPSKYVPNWDVLEPQYQAIFLEGWEIDLMRNRELAEIMRGLVSARGGVP
jgi:hypothetical protein